MFTEPGSLLTLTGNQLKKYRQKKKILALLYKCGSLSGPVISRRVGVSLPTVIALLNELSEMNFIENKGTGTSRGGRKPVLYGLVEDSIFTVACEVERYCGKISIYNTHNKPVTDLVRFDTSIDDPLLTNKLYEHTTQLVASSGIDKKRILGVGLTMPGLIDETGGRNLTIQNEKYQNVKQRLEQKFNMLVYVNNDARMQAYGEYNFGLAKDYDNAIVVTWNWGIGLGIIANGKLYNGTMGFAGELSHIQLVEEGNLCICGKRGCLETVAPAYVLVQEAIKGIEENRVSQLTYQFKHRTKDLKPTDVIQAAKTGDELVAVLVALVYNFRTDRKYLLRFHTSTSRMNLGRGRMNILLIMKMMPVQFEEQSATVRISVLHLMDHPLNSSTAQPVNTCPTKTITSICLIMARPKTYRLQSREVTKKGICVWLIPTTSMMV